MASNDLCKACTLLEGLERGIASVAVVSTHDGVWSTYADISRVDRPRAEEIGCGRPGT